VLKGIPEEQNAHASMFSPIASTNISIPPPGCGSSVGVLKAHAMLLDFTGCLVDISVDIKPPPFAQEAPAGLVVQFITE
jgi:hypothetical protein